MQRADSGHYRVTVQPKWQHNLGPILAQFLHHCSVVRIWVLFWFILWLKYLRFSKARFGSPLVELLKVLFWLILARVLAENYGPIYLLARALILVRVIANNITSTVKNSGLRSPGRSKLNLLKWYYYCFKKRNIKILSINYMYEFYKCANQPWDIQAVFISFFQKYPHSFLLTNVL